MRFTFCPISLRDNQIIFLRNLLSAVIRAPSFRCSILIFVFRFSIPDFRLSIFHFHTWHCKSIQHILSSQMLHVVNFNLNNNECLQFRLSKFRFRVWIGHRRRGVEIRCSTWSEVCTHCAIGGWVCESIQEIQDQTNPKKSNKWIRQSSLNTKIEKQKFPEYWGWPVASSTSESFHIFFANSNFANKNW